MNNDANKSGSVTVSRRTLIVLLILVLFLIIGAIVVVLTGIIGSVQSQTVRNQPRR